MFSTLNWRYLAFIVLLAGWVWFCYRMFATRIHAIIHEREQAVTLVRVDGLTIPFAFNWGSALPLAGDQFDNWKRTFGHLDSTGHIAIIRGGYFRDEEPTQASLNSLGKARIASFLREVPVDSHRIMKVIGPLEINADVRSKPFAAVTIELVAEQDLFALLGDTAQLCFPVAENLTLPPYSLDQFQRWVAQHGSLAEQHAYITGTADGTGVAESSDVALDRAEAIREILLRYGWKPDSIHLDAVQRNTLMSLHNRCVLVYFGPG